MSDLEPGELLEKSCFAGKMAHEMNELILHTLFCEDLDGLTDIKAYLRAKYVFPSLERVAANDAFPEYTEVVKAHDLDGLWETAEKHPYFGYESTVLTCKKLGIATNDGEGNSIPYNVVRDQITAHNKLVKSLKEAEKEVETKASTKVDKAWIVRKAIVIIEAHLLPGDDGEAVAMFNTFKKEFGYDLDEGVYKDE
jgi:hypothetical protein